MTTKCDYCGRHYPPNLTRRRINGKMMCVECVAAGLPLEPTDSADEDDEPTDPIGPECPA